MSSTESQQQRSTLTKQVDEYIETDAVTMAQNPVNMITKRNILCFQGWQKTS